MEYSQTQSNLKLNINTSTKTEVDKLLLNDSGLSPFQSILIDDKIAENENISKSNSPFNKKSDKLYEQQIVTSNQNYDSFYAKK